MPRIIIFNFGTVVAEPDYYDIGDDGTLTVAAATGVLANDFSTDGSVTAINYTNAGHGSVSLGEDGSFVYTPDAGFVGDDSFVYTMESGTITNSATVTIDVYHDAPIASAATYVVQAGSTLTEDALQGVLANDIAFQGTVIATNYTTANHGSVSLSEDGSFTYTPDAGYVGTDSFTYYISDGVQSASATVTLDVVDPAPIANNDTYVVRGGQELTVGVAGGLLANDLAFQGTLIATNYTTAGHGTVDLTEDGSFTYTPDAGYVGPDSFTYFISDGVESASATATINVVDNPPVAEPDFYHTTEDQALSVNVAQGLLANDFDPDGDPIIATNYTNAGHGSVSLGEDGSFNYMPNTGYVGDDSFTYYISDGALTASSTVTIDVMASVTRQSTVTANPDSYDIAEDGTLSVASATGLLANDFTNRGSLIATNYTDAAHGTLSVGENGSFDYTPDAGFVGVDNFTYFVSNGSVSNSATVTIDVYHDAPIASAATYVVHAGSTLTEDALQGVLANDIAFQGTLIATNYSNANHGSVSLSEDGSFTYTPDAGYVGTDNFTYYISDGVQSASAIVTLDVVEAPPIANNDTYVVRTGQELTVGVAGGLLANDIAFLGSVVATNYTNAGHGTVDLTENGSFTYTPDAGYVGPDSFTYYISDGVESASATATINVVGDPPVAEPDFYHTTEDQALSVNVAQGVLANDFDPDGNPIIATNYTNAGHGTVSLGEDGSFDYTPDAGFVGDDSFTYYISDGALTDSSTALIDVVACYCPGTRIRTVRSDLVVEDRPVETLVAGDLVLTVHGQARPITWVGQGRALAVRGRRNAATPVIVRKGALSDNVPHADLRITKGHSLFIDGVLVPVEYLVNHRSILWDDHAQEVTVYHIELETHDVLLAEGAPAESYRDDGNRWLFRNANSRWDVGTQEPCAPVLTGGPIVDAIWRRLLDRAGARGSAPLTEDADLHVVADGQRVDAVSRTNDTYVFCLPAVPVDLRLVSRSVVPAEFGFARDPRPLGVAVRRIAAFKGWRLRVIEADDDRLASGFHLFEADNGFRWTDGEGLIPLDIFSDLAGTVELFIDVAATTRYLDDGLMRSAA